MALRLRSCVFVAAAVALGSAALGDDLVQMIEPDPFTTAIEVNGTAGPDTIILASLPDGSILVTRIAGVSLAYDFISAADAGSLPILVYAGDGNDFIDTTALSASATLEIHGEGGDDVINCGPGNDLIYGEDGNDTITGGAGDDTILGGAGAHDRLYGGAGFDSITDEDGVDVASGGAGDDSIAVIFGESWDNNSNPFDGRASLGKITGGDGDDFVWIYVMGGALTLQANGDNQGVNLTPGQFDQIEITGPLGAGSAFPNFESVTINP